MLLFTHADFVVLVLSLHTHTCNFMAKSKVLLEQMAILSNESSLEVLSADQLDINTVFISSW